MKKPLIISIILSIVLVASLGFLFLDDYNNPSNEIIHQLERDDIKAVAMLTN